MSEILTIGVTLIIGIAIGILIPAIITLRMKKKSSAGKKKKKVQLDTFVKIITLAVLIHGMILTTCSYILAAFGLDPVIDVSTTIVREIVAPLITYMGTNCIMNIFEKNKLSFSVPINSSIISKGKKVTGDGVETEETENTTASSEACG